MHDLSATIRQLSVLFGTQSKNECNTLAQSGAAPAGDVNAMIKSSLSVICQGAPKAIAIKDTCPAPGGETRIAFSQTHSFYSNIVEIIKPCGS